MWKAIKYCIVFLTNFVDEQTTYLLILNAVTKQDIRLKYLSFLEFIFMDKKVLLKRILPRKRKKMEWLQLYEAIKHKVLYYLDKTVKIFYRFFEFFPKCFFRKIRKIFFLPFFDFFFEKDGLMRREKREREWASMYVKGEKGEGGLWSKRNI